MGENQEFEAVGQAMLQAETILSRVRNNNCTLFEERCFHNILIF